jgi:hypothetical protein
MNRGDLYTFHFGDYPQGISDYDRIIALGPEAVRGTSVCGHRILAMNHDNFFLSFPEFFLRRDLPGCQ